MLQSLPKTLYNLGGLDYKMFFFLNFSQIISILINMQMKYLDYLKHPGASLSCNAETIFSLCLHLHLLGVLFGQVSHCNLC